MARAALALCLANACHLAFAQAPSAPATPLQSVAVRGALPLRTDVHALCPDVDDALNAALYRVVQELGQGALVDVRFELQGSRISSVQTQGGPLRYRNALKRAVRGLGCKAAESGEGTGATGGAAQQVVMRVQFVDPFGPGARAGLSAAAVLAGASAPTR